jgi:Xaa-Pro aminopeptidase
MQEYLRGQVDWPQAFPAEEYAGRLAKVQSALKAAELDAIYVTHPANITYLTGYDMIWNHLRSVTGLLVSADSDATVFFDVRAHTTMVYTTPEIREIVWLDDSSSSSNTEIDEVNVIARELDARGFGTASIGIEKWGYSPHASVVDALEREIQALGARVVDATDLIEDIRLVKSPLEVLHVRKAAAIADEAMLAARDAIRPGITETELEGVIMATMMTAGGGDPGIRTMVASGPRSGTHHSPPTRRQVNPGDLVHIDFCSSYDRYHVNLCRTFSLGEPDPRWTKLLDDAVGCIDAIVAEVSSGDPLRKADEIGNAYIDAAGLRKYVWWIGGYSLGIAQPPDWCGRYWMNREESTERDFEPGIVVNLENCFDVWENWPGGSGASYVDSLLMTDTGLEVLSTLPRNIIVVGE